MLIDVHAHLTHELFSKDLDKVIDNAKKAGVKYILNSGVNSPSNRLVLEMSKKYDITKCSFGLYPIDLLGSVPDEAGLPRQIEPINMEKEFEFIKENLDDTFAIGEVGLDYKWDLKQHEQQKKNFQMIIEFVEKINKPIILHTRKAERDVLDMIESSRLKNVDLHCFQGNKKLIKRAADNGHMFSIPPVIVKLQHFQLLVEMVDINQLLTETDCPWLGPYEGRNEPSFVTETIKKISEIKKLDSKDVEEKIFSNFKRVFLK